MEIIMYLRDYFGFMIAIIGCLILSGLASGRVKSVFRKYDGVKCRSKLSGYDTAVRLLQVNGACDISIGSVRGFLTDHYDPARALVNLSEATYDSYSIAAVAVAAHEIGHVMQKRDGYGLYRFRAMIVPVVNFGTYLATPLVLIGLLLDRFAVAADTNTGYYLAMIGVILYGGALLFALVTLPVEWNASKRAKEMLLSTGILFADELPAAKAVLSAAALTYLASLLTALVLFLRFLIQVLTLFGRRDYRR